MMLATIDNPSNAVKWTMAEMINQPDILAKACEELDRVIGKNRLVQESDLSKLNYVKACLKESFRIHPVSPFTLPHISSKNIVMGGYFIPKGSHVVLSRPGLGRNPRIWDEPLRFKPERHIVDEVSNVSLVDHDLRILSFSTGRQGCPTLELGSTTTTMLLARLIQGFSWKQPLDTSTIDLAESKHDLSLAKPLIAHAVPRTPFHFISNEMQLYIHMFTSLMEGLVFGEADSTTIVTGNNHDFLVYPKIRGDSSTKNSPS
ncbi:hypothetical protein SASPL_141530 [Salvia splendens]|uniref:Tryptophan N-monooxygenase n=1 Tax=Salvia splendens TaxID=180675 RepID=A0A8X8WS41_SALSN|nr:hypothetical protein SASPL_141530 [Salvia splendens]